MKLKDTATAFARALGVYRSASSSSAEIAAEIDGLEAEISASPAAIAKAEADRREAVLAGDAGAIAKTGLALEAVRERNEHTAIILDGLRQRLDEAHRAEAIAASKARYDTAKRDRDALAKELPAILRRMGDEGASLIARVEAVEAALQAANADLPEGAAPLIDPYAEVCGTIGQPEAIVSEDEVIEWCHAGTWQRLLPDQRKRVDVMPGDPNRGTLSTPPTGIASRGFADMVERRPFRRIRFMLAVPNDWPEPIRDALRIPTAVSRSARPRREQGERFEPIRDAAADAA